MGTAMKRHLTEHLADLAPPGLAEAIAPGEGFEVIVDGLAVRWHQTAAPAPRGQECVWRLAQPDGPLRAEAFLRVEPAHRAADWRVELTNAGREDRTVEAVYPMVVRFPRYDGPWRTLTALGGTTENFYPPRAYRPAERVVFGGEIRIESHEAGRSSNRHLPLLLATAGPGDDAPGLFCGMEYSGEWFLTLRHVGNAPFLRGLLKTSGIVVAAGETLALPAVHVGFFDGGLARGTNALRRYLRDRVCPPAKDPSAWPPVSYNHWTGIQNDFDEALLRRQVARSADLGVEYWIHDASWFEGNFPAGVGNWRRADPAKYPRGLRPLADFVRAKGMKFGLWFEIERAEEGTWAIEKHRELFFPPRASWCGRSYHLDLSRPAAADWAVRTLSRWIDELELDWLKLDYNIDPAPYFHAADPTGKVQLAYGRGLYRVLETLRTDHPRLVIENCASGGRRIDLGTLRRSDIHWISDHSFNPHISRYMLCRFARFIPSHLASSAVSVRAGAGDAGFGDLDALSRMCGAWSVSGDVAGWSRRLTRRMRKWADAYKRVRHLIGQDFRELLGPPATDRHWDAVQFAAPDAAEHLVLAYRMAGERGRACLPLVGIDPAADYTVTNLARPNRPRAIPGDRLARRGLAVTLKPHAAAAYLLRASA